MEKKSQVTSGGKRVGKYTHGSFFVQYEWQMYERVWSKVEKPPEPKPAPCQSRRSMLLLLTGQRRRKGGRRYRRPWKGDSSWHASFKGGQPLYNMEFYQKHIAEEPDYPRPRLPSLIRQDLVDARPCLWMHELDPPMEIKQRRLQAVALFHELRHMQLPLPLRRPRPLPPAPREQPGEKPGEEPSKQPGKLTVLPRLPRQLRLRARNQPQKVPGEQPGKLGKPEAKNQA